MKAELHQALRVAFLAGEARERLRALEHMRHRSEETSPRGFGDASAPWWMGPRTGSWERGADRDVVVAPAYARRGVPRRSTHHSVFFLGALPAAAEKRVSSWFGEKAGQPYADVRSEIEQAAKIALEAQVPEELLVERLAEGAAKGVPP